jgi:hypothetical protein
VPQQDDVERARDDRRPGGVADDVAHVQSGRLRLGSGSVDHRGGEVDTGDVMAGGCREQRQRAGAAAEARHRRRRLWQPLRQALPLGLTYAGIGQPVVRC